MEDDWIILGDGAGGSDTDSFSDGSSDSDAGFTIVRRGHKGGHGCSSSSVVVSGDAPAPPRVAAVAVPQPTPPGLPFKVVSYGEAFSASSSEQTGCHDEATAGEAIIVQGAGIDDVAAGTGSTDDCTVTCKEGCKSDQVGEHDGTGSYVEAPSGPSVAEAAAPAVICPAETTAVLHGEAHSELATGVDQGGAEEVEDEDSEICDEEDDDDTESSSEDDDDDDDTESSSDEDTDSSSEEEDEDTDSSKDEGDEDPDQDSSGEEEDEDTFSSGDEEDEDTFSSGDDEDEDTFSCGNEEDEDTFGYNDEEDEGYTQSEEDEEDTFSYTDEEDEDYTYTESFSEEYSETCSVEEEDDDAECSVEEEEEDGSETSGVESHDADNTSEEEDDAESSGEEEVEDGSESYGELSHDADNTAEEEEDDDSEVSGEEQEAEDDDAECSAEADDVESTGDGDAECSGEEDDVESSGDGSDDPESSGAGSDDGAESYGEEEEEEEDAESTYEEEKEEKDVVSSVEEEKEEEEEEDTVSYVEEKEVENNHVVDVVAENGKKDIFAMLFPRPTTTACDANAEAEHGAANTNRAVKERSESDMDTDSSDMEDDDCLESHKEDGIVDVAESSNQDIFAMLFPRATTACHANEDESEHGHVDYAEEDEDIFKMLLPKDTACHANIDAYEEESEHGHVDIPDWSLLEMLLPRDHAIHDDDVDTESSGMEDNYWDWPEFAGRAARGYDDVDTDSDMEESDDEVAADVNGTRLYGWPRATTGGGVESQCWGFASQSRRESQFMALALWENLQRRVPEDLLRQLVVEAFESSSGQQRSYDDVDDTCDVPGTAAPGGGGGPAGSSERTPEAQFTARAVRDREREVAMEEARRRESAQRELDRALAREAAAAVQALESKLEEEAYATAERQATGVTRPAVAEPHVRVDLTFVIGVYAFVCLVLCLLPLVFAK